MSTRSPAREKLAVAIERHAAARERLAAIQAAQENHASAIVEARRAAKLANERVEHAKSFAAEQLVMPGRNEPATTIKQARAAAQEAADGVAVAEEAEVKLVEMHQQARQSLFWTEHNLRDAISHAVQADDAISKVVARYDAARREVANLAVTLNFVSKFVAQEVVNSWHAIRDYDDLPGATDWQAAVAALESNPDAPLPT